MDWNVTQKNFQNFIELPVIYKLINLFLILIRNLNVVLKILDSGINIPSIYNFEKH